MKHESLTLFSGDRSRESAEVICLRLGTELPDLELAPVVVPREILATRASPHPWEKTPEEWYAKYGEAQWVWTTRTFEPVEEVKWGKERSRARRYFDLPDAAPGSIKIRLVACCVGGMSVNLNGESVVNPDWGPDSADNYYVEVDEDVTFKALAKRNLLEFDIKRRYSLRYSKRTLPAGLIYRLDISWERETKAGVLAKAVAGTLRVLASATFRVLGLLGFLVFFCLALYPSFDNTTRIVFATIAAGFIGALNLPALRRDLQQAGGNRK